MVAHEVREGAMPGQQKLLEGKMEKEVLVLQYRKIYSHEIFDYLG